MLHFRKYINSDANKPMRHVHEHRATPQILKPDSEPRLQKNVVVTHAGHEVWTQESIVTINLSCMQQFET